MKKIIILVLTLFVFTIPYKVNAFSINESLLDNSFIRGTIENKEESSGKYILDVKIEEIYVFDFIMCDRDYNNLFYINKDSNIKIEATPDQYEIIKDYGEAIFWIKHKNENTFSVFFELFPIKDGKLVLPSLSEDSVFYSYNQKLKRRSIDMEFKDGLTIEELTDYFNIDSPTLENTPYPKPEISSVLYHEQGDNVIISWHQKVAKGVSYGIIESEFKAHGAITVVDLFLDNKKIASSEEKYGNVVFVLSKEIFNEKSKLEFFGETTHYERLSEFNTEKEIIQIPELTMKINNTKEISSSIFKNNEFIITWRSENENIATVTDNFVKAISSGEVILIGSIGGYGDIETIKVIVNNEEIPVDPVTPVDPVDPVDPVNPVDPIDPVTPEEPVKPGCNSVPSMNTVFSFMIILFAFRKKRYWFE
ncbi:MAG: hypothetical protein RBR48_04085 [Bacilli bacterium]|nr:hypothetical protein [Bacilli bacterium]